MLLFFRCPCCIITCLSFGFVVCLSVRARAFKFFPMEESARDFAKTHLNCLLFCSVCVHALARVCVTFFIESCVPLITVNQRPGKSVLLVLQKWKYLVNGSAITGARGLQLAGGLRFRGSWSWTVNRLVSLKWYRLRAGLGPQETTIVPGYT